MASDVPGTVYLLHLDPPYKHARHYLGWAADLAARLAEHQQGRGARLLAVQKAAGGTWHLTRTWPDATRGTERRIKDTARVPDYCPDCQPARSAARRTARQATHQKGTVMPEPTFRELAAAGVADPEHQHAPEGEDAALPGTSPEVTQMADALMQTAVRDIARQTGAPAFHVPSGIRSDPHADREAGC